MARTLDEAALLRLIDALAPGDWVSGAVLAQASGISREALSKRMRHLGDWQLEIESRPGLGYRLAHPLQRLDAAAILAELPPQWRQDLDLRVLPRTDSTNTQLLNSPAGRDPQALLAESQTAGRGRRGRVWRSPFGANLYLSVAWSFPAWPPQLSTLSLAAGVCCARALRRVGLDGVALKWPNDLWLNRAKLGGILIEQRGEAGGTCRVVIGFGLNVTMSESQAGVLDQAWTTVEESLRAMARPAPARTVLAAALLEALLSGLEQFAVSGFASFESEWSALDLTRGCEVNVTGVNRGLAGTARGVDADGALLVENAQGLHAIHAGDVSLRLT